MRLHLWFVSLFEPIQDTRAGEWLGPNVDNPSCEKERRGYIVRDVFPSVKHILGELDCLASSSASSAVLSSPRLVLGLPGNGGVNTQKYRDDIVENVEVELLVKDDDVNYELKKTPKGKHSNKADDETQDEVLDVETFHG
jgi:hypothetical protein